MRFCRLKFSRSFLSSSFVTEMSTKRFHADPCRSYHSVSRWLVAVSASVSLITVQSSQPDNLSLLSIVSMTALDDSSLSSFTATAPPHCVSACRNTVDLVRGGRGVACVMWASRRPSSFLITAPRPCVRVWRGCERRRESMAWTSRFLSASNAAMFKQRAPSWAPKGIVAETKKAKSRRFTIFQFQTVTTLLGGSTAVYPSTSASYSRTVAAFDGYLVLLLLLYFDFCRILYSFAYHVFFASSR